jgi:hypothetical protein
LIFALRDILLITKCIMIIYTSSYIDIIYDI